MCSWTCEYVRGKHGYANMIHIMFCVVALYMHWISAACRLYRIFSPLPTRVRLRAIFRQFVVGNGVVSVWRRVSACVYLHLITFWLSKHTQRNAHTNNNMIVQSAEWRSFGFMRVVCFRAATFRSLIHCHGYLDCPRLSHTCLVLNNAKLWVLICVRVVWLRCVRAMGLKTEWHS